MDRVDTATRSRIMRAIRGRDTKPELQMVAALEALGVGYTREPRFAGLRARPDFLVGTLVVFVHGCYWHGCRFHYRPSQTRPAEWAAHIDRNRARDRRVRRALRALGWQTMVVWEHEDMTAAARRVVRRHARIANGGR